jgi:hypothetical protein
VKEATKFDQHNRAKSANPKQKAEDNEKSRDKWASRSDNTAPGFEKGTT